jgi:hypothetical protein
MDRQPNIVSLFRDMDGYLVLHESSSGRNTTMSIREIIQQVIKTGYLSVEVEKELQLVFTTQEYDLYDLNAFMSLQLATLAGKVKQQSRELI